MKIRRIFIILSVVIMTILFLSKNLVYAKPGSSLNVGDFIKFGSYNGEKILWKVIKDDDTNKRVMLMSFRIITMKAFDASHADDYLGVYGNYNWNESNLRDWLNSYSVPHLDDDEWTHQKPDNPTYNNYVDEAGFLSNFLQEERNIIVKMNDDGEENDNGNKVSLLTEDDISYLTSLGYWASAKPTEQAVNKCEYKSSNLNQNSNYEYWIRNPYQSKIVSYSGSVSSSPCPYCGNVGVCPVLWLNISNITLNELSEGMMANPYIVISCDNIDPTGVFSPSSSGLTNNDVIVTFNPNDEYSGVDYYKYSISLDNGNSYGSEITVNGNVSQDIVLSDNGNIKIKVVVYDNAGNNSTLYSGIYKIDKVKPTNPNVTYSPEGMTNGNVTVSINYSSDSNVKQYKIDNGSWNTYNNIFTVSENCKITARGQDEAGNYTDEVICNISNIDKLKPNNPNMTYSPEGMTNGNVTINVEYSDDSIIKEYKINNDSWSVYKYEIIVNQNCKITARGQDEAGNYSDEISCNITNIDRIAPDDATFELSTTEITNENVIVTVHYGDDVIIKEYKIGDSGSFISYSNPIEVSENCTIYVRGYDSAGNESNVTSISITNIEKSGPKRPIVNKDTGVYTEEIEVEIIKGDNNTIGIYYTLDGTMPTNDSNLYNEKIKIDGAHNEEVVLKVVSFNVMGNKSTVVEKRYLFNKEYIDLKEVDRKNFKYYVGIDKDGLIKAMLISKTGKNLGFDISDILELEGENKGCFKDGIIYIDENGEFRKYKIYK